LPKAELEHLAGQMQICNLSPGEILFREGDHGDHFYVIEHGDVEIIKAFGTENERLIAIRQSGDFIGELSLINPAGLRMAMVRARTEVSLWQLSRHDFEEVLNNNAPIAHRIVRELSQRLTNAHEKTIVDLQAKNRELTRAYNQLKAAQEQIIEKERMDHELQLAHNIQISILPTSLPETESFSFGALLQPARAVGGDFYDVFMIGKNRIGVLIGDVADKGVPSALVMAQTHALLYAEAIRGIPPAEVMATANHQMLRLNRSGLFVTSIYGIIDLDSRIFSYARAGHEIPYILTPDQDASALPKNIGQPLGLFDEPTFDIQQVSFSEGTRLLLYTDGAADMHDQGEVQFGLQRLLQEFSAGAALDPQTACRQIYETLARYQGTTSQDDDITMVMIQGN
jgi:serine phosphatase RsbU (regulator of sigma subunit)